MTRKPKPVVGKRRFMVSGQLTISVHTDVVASSPEEARAIAEERGLMSFCNQCSNGEPDEEWTTSGELDGVPSPFDGDAEFTVEELP